MDERTDQHYFLIRATDTENVEGFKSDTRFQEVAEEGDWLFGWLDQPEEIDNIAEQYLDGWGSAYYVKDPLGGGGSFVAYENREYGVERVASNGFRGGYHYVRNYITSYAGADFTTPPESIPKDRLGSTFNR